MSLDFQIKFDDEMFHFNISESLHSSIFSNSTRWSSFKQLRKIKDYYRTDCLFKGGDAVLFINEFIAICENNSLEERKIEEIKSLLSKKIIYIRVSGD
ncbi:MULTISPECIES: hypothetical protein [Pectobacterium]|uniref:Uncharacterized protein n=1 Tax=Pectobacterium aquaticum TaxID=2204145 RepID=A0AA93AMY6_9GAMM|nr:MULTISPECIES: hypothetical protein [Pectobacterium]MDY4374567.1 hypothetical protein [Pectobacterium carotovorum subsp. carotovorum]RRO21942.1 hypothetical protein DMB84_007100 [Pectobacterium aquaticum]UEM39533.1 hypothetical protein DMB82_0000255 [Pectobacterium aquaticum]ULS49240.1 hypothetical protein GBN63_05280 [Pectobacterium carotovorum]GKV91650.1 hypothetical protein PEC301619_36320 [Pectobacterium carotovorum subsp. carotovorum]